MRLFKKQYGRGHFLMAIGGGALLLIVLAPVLGLGKAHEFILFRWFDVTRSIAAMVASIPLLVGTMLAFPQMMMATATAVARTLRATPLRRFANLALAIGVILLSLLGTVAFDSLIGRMRGSVDTTPSVATVAFRQDGEFVRLQGMEGGAYNRTEYSSFLTWGYKDFRSEWVNVVDGVRQTRNPPIEPGKPVRTIWFFGGSTMLGQGSDDANTIPAHTCRYLSQLWPQFSWHCVNFGVGGYVSTQELVRLEIALRNAGGSPPDNVIFYDGVNDFIAALQGYPGEHHEYSLVRDKMGRQVDLPNHPNQPDLSADWAASLHLAERLVRGTALHYYPNLMALLSARSQAATPATPSPTLTEVPREVAERVAKAADIYNRNRSLCRTLLAEAPFRTTFAFQPSFFSADRQVPEEDHIRRRPYANFRYAYLLGDLWNSFHEAVTKADPGTGPRCLSIDLSQAFSDERRPIFFDWMHVFPLGNQRVGYALALEVSRQMSLPVIDRPVEFDAPTLSDGDVNISKRLK